MLSFSVDHSEVLVPRPGTKYPDSFYCEFNTWFLGRLFYVWSVKELDRIHETSKQAQLKILNILCANGASFYDKIHAEYMSVFGKLIEYYKQRAQPEQMLLENFTSQQIHCPNVQLNLEPIYVKVNNIETCERLIDCTLNLLSDTLPMNSGQTDSHSALYEALLDQILQVLEYFSLDLKLSVLNFYMKLINNYDKYGIDRFQVLFPNIYKELLYSVEAMTTAMSVYHEKGEINVDYIDSYNKVLKSLIKVDVTQDSNVRETVTNICTTILRTSDTNIFKKELKQHCLSLSDKLDFPKDVTDMSKIDASLINTVTECYSQEILEHVQDMKGVDFKDSWYYKQILDAIKKLKCCEEQNIDSLVVADHLKKCASALNILTSVHLLRKNDVSEVNLINSDNIFCIWMSLIKTIENYINFLLQDRNCAFIMEITLNTAILSNNMSKEDSNTILQLLCLQNTQQFTEKSLNFTDSVKLCITKYIMLIKLILEKKMTTKLSELWTRVISVLINSLISCKSTQTYQELISLCPLLLSNKVCSASKLIGDLLMPAFLTKYAKIQKELTKALKTISCMSFVDYIVVVKPLKDNKESDHLVFENGFLNVSVACLKCFKTKEESDKEFLTKIRHDCLVIYSEVNNCTPSQHSTITGLRNLMAKFLNCKYYANLEESGFWSLMETMFKHFYMFDVGLSSDIVKVENSCHLIKVLKPYLDDSTVHEEGSESYKQREKALLLCVNLLVESTKTCLESNQHSVQTHTLNVITQFGSCCSQQVIIPSTKLLVYFIMHPQCSLRSKAVLFLREICEKHGFTPNQVYHRYKNDYCKLFVECSLYNGKEFATAILNVVRAFGFVGYRDFISKDVHHLLPYLVPYTVSIKEVPSMIEEIASLVQCSVSDFLIERFPYIYVHIYLNESKEVSSKCYDIIERLTETTVLSLIKRHFRVILTEFLLQYCCNPEKVLDACRYLARHDPDMTTPGANINMNTNDIADFLNPKFLGVLAYFDHKLVNAKVALSVKRKALKSFPDILQLMGVKYLTPLRFKVLATLRSALPLAKEFPQILAEAWSAFIHNIDSISLAPLLSNLAVFLMQQYHYAAREINKIFHYLVLNNEHLLSTHIADLFFLEDTQLPDKIKLVIKRHVRRTQPEAFLDKIKWYLKQLEQDIPSIKSHAFRHLDQLLKSNRTEIHRAIFAGNQIHPVMVELIDALLLGCLEREAAVSSASGACLGQLGAIEAAHLPRQYVQPDRSSFAFYIVDNSFVATALQELCRAFQYEQDTANMDCYALTIQEILKMYDISPTGSEKEVWDSFPEHMHQIMYPLLTSRYTLAYPSQPKKAHPLFGSAYATTFLEWAHNWWGQLVPLVECASVGALLRAVQPSMRRDSRTLFLFLPYVLLHAVTNTASHRYIQGEINAVIGLENFEAESVATDNTRYKMLRHIRYTPSIHSVQAEEGNQSKCSKTVYALLDFLNRWLLEWCATKTQPLEHEHYKAISSFLDKFDKLTIARGNFACGELERALQYLELYMSENKEKMQEQLPFLAEIYAALDEPDSVAGILSMKQSEPSLSELILAQVAAGRLQDAALCYERLAQETHLDTHSLQGMVSCYLALEQPFTARRLLGEQADSMLELSAEPLWRLASWDQLHALTQRPVPQSEENWGLHMGRILLAYRSQDHDRFTVCCKDATSRLLAQMDKESKGENALRSGYQSVLGLHIVSEATRAEEVFRRLKSSSDGGSEGSSLVCALLEEWRRRAALVQSDVRSVEPLLRARRVLLRDTQEALEPTHPLTANKLKSCIGELWLQSAKLARKAEMYQQAYMYILSAEQYQPAELFVEKSKMYWKRGQHEQAFTTLRRGLEEGYTHIHTLTPEQRKICAKAKLLIAKYNDETTKVDVDVNIGFYKESVDVFKEWEKSWVCLGAYYEKVCSSEGSAASSLWTRRLYALNSYGKALQCGHKYLYQSMPRMLSIWLDVEVSAHDTSVHSILAQMTEIIKTYSERLPLYLYLTAFSQIVSRICHPVKEVYLQLKAIIVQLIVAYPQHTLWNMMSVIKSSYPQRIKRCNEVLADQRLKEPRRLKLLNDFTLLAEKLIELCNKPIAHTGRSSTVSSLVRTLPKLLETQNFSHIMMPFQEFCKIVLPSKAARQEKIDFHVPVEPVVYIAGIEEHIQILPSLQKPRKVTLKGSDGKSYIIMLKPRDDLRKDYRLMEFNGVVNRFLQDAPETRRRRLYIRTYSVLPLNEECGVIEWVPNLVGLRPILVHIYKQKGIQTLNKELRQLMCSNKDPLEKKRRIFEEQLLPRHPPVFQEWFRRVFSDPYGWYQARSAYIRTTAVISMVGYILGLGDRHGENISFDSTNGDTVHVDFNCLFNKGEALECPEVVPFRLTHNMEAAMGPLGHEGMFRKSCECVLRALRAQTAALMSVVGPFVYDPLVSWGRARTLDPERTNELALQHLLHIRHRLNGMVRNKNKQLSVSLSPEGQVEHLIEEATSVTNLCQMYVGWGPFL